MIKDVHGNSVPSYDAGDGNMVVFQSAKTEHFSPTSSEASKP
jgi:hypothetical protein